MKKDKKGFAETVDQVTDKIDETAVAVESFTKKTINWFKRNWKWLISCTACVIVGFTAGAIIF
jgi:hypothetical protein